MGFPSLLSVDVHLVNCVAGMERRVSGVGRGGGIISNFGAREEGRGRSHPSYPFSSPSGLVALTFSPFPPLSAPVTQAPHLAEPST